MCPEVCAHGLVSLLAGPGSMLRGSSSSQQSLGANLYIYFDLHLCSFFSSALLGVYDRASSTVLGQNEVQVQRGLLQECSGLGHRVMCGHPRAYDELKGHR